MTRPIRSELSRAALLALLTLPLADTLLAADAIWDNGAHTFTWDLTQPNWSGQLWNNGAGNAATFSTQGSGAIALVGAIRASSLNFQANGYTLNGTGTLGLVAGSGSLAQGTVNTEAGVTARINSALGSSVGLVKSGAGTLELSGPLSFSGPGLPMISNFAVYNDLYIAGISQVSKGGTVRLLNGGVLPASARVGISNGLLDIGGNNVTVAALNFFNQADSSTYDPLTRAGGTGVIGSGTLRVSGDITVRGASAGNDGANTIATNLDLGGGTQIIRISNNQSTSLYRALQITGVISNGSLLKTTGLNENGIPGIPDGIALYGNNTYTGSTVLNGGNNLVTGTNASSLVKIAGNFSGPGAGQLILMGADGSYGAASVLQAFAGGQLVIDNTMAQLATDGPQIAAANNNNRFSDTAQMQLRDGQFIYKGFANTASSETFGKLSVLGGHNVVTLTPAGTGTVTINAAGGLELAPRATLQFTSATLGAASKLFVGGTPPAADSTGILQRIIGNGNFVTYDAATGITPLAAAAYAGSFAAGANVALTAASTAATSVNINALKTSGSFTTTIGAGQTLGIASGMVLNSSGTATYSGGTIDFGSNAGTFFGGTNVVNSALAGSDGLINASGTLTLAGNLAGLSGALTVSSGAVNLATNTFAGPIQLRSGTLAINTSQTLAGQGALTIGVSQNDANLIGTIPVVNMTGAGANAVMARDIIVDNGAQNAAGMQFWYSMLPILSGLSASSGSQTVSGNIVLNSPLRVTNGATASNTGALNFSGDISGSGWLEVQSARVNFTGNIGNTGGMRLGEAGFTTQVSLLGTTTSMAPLTIVGGNSNRVSYAPGALPGGAILFWNGPGTTANIFTPLATSTINNDMTAQFADINTNVGAGIVSTWNGKVTTDATGYLIKQGTGTLVLNNAGNNAITLVKGGTLLVNGALAGEGVAVYAGATLGGTGTIAGEIDADAGSVVAPGAGIGTLRANRLTLNGSLLAEIDFAQGADLIDVGSGGVTLGSGAQLALALANLPGAGAGFAKTWLLVANGSSGAIGGTFGSVAGLDSLPAGYSWSLNYAFAGTDALGRIGDGNDLALSITAVPEPGSWAMLTCGGALLLWLRRRRA